MEALELRVPPLAQAAVVAAGMWGLSEAFPALRLPLPGIVLAIPLFVTGAVVAFSAVLAFRRANTTVDPRLPNKATRLVVGGVYRYSRNPMYLGFLLILLGFACYLGNLTAFLMLPVFVAYMNRFQIARL